MKAGLSVQQLVEKLDREAKSKCDIRTDSKNVGNERE